MEIAREIFRAYDIRGIYGKNLFDKDAILIGKAIGSEVIAQGGNKIAVAYDGRDSSPNLVKNLIEGLCSTGINVVNIGAVPTPLLYFSCFYHNLENGVMVTGSHNPKEHNGFKVVINKEARSGAQITSLYSRIANKDFLNLNNGKIGVVEELNIIDDYIQDVVTKISISSALKIVIDCGNGITGVLAKELFGNFAEVIDIYSDVDSDFPNHHPDPSNLDNLQDLIAHVVSNNAHLGIAFDGDGDRLGVVTNEGIVINPDRQLMLFAADILMRNPDSSIVYDVKCTNKLADFIKSKKGNPVMWKTGHSLIKAKMIEENAPLAGEMSGHIFFKERWYGFDDALYAASRLLEIISEQMIEKPISMIFSELPDSINTPEISIPVAEEDKLKIIDKLRECGDFGDINKVINIDGLRVEYDDGWGLVRASNTTSNLVLRFEADTYESLERIQNIFGREIRRINSEINISQLIA